MAAEHPAYVPRPHASVSPARPRGNSCPGSWLPGRRDSTWRPGRDSRAVRHPGPPGRLRPAGEPPSALVVGGGIAGLAATVGLAERGVRVTLLEREQQLGGRVGAWPVQHGVDRVMMSRGFHAFFRQYYNLRRLLRRADPALARLRPVEDYPLWLAGGHADSFATIPRTPPLNLAAFVLRSPSFTLADLRRVDVGAALELLDVEFPRTFSDYDGESAAAFLDRLHFPDAARHLALEVFARSFFADPRDFAAGELVAMFHSYFLGSAEGLLFDVPDDDYDTALWAPLGRHLQALGVTVRTASPVEAVDVGADRVRVRLESGAAEADALVVACDPASTRRLLTDGGIGSQDWRRRLAQTTNAPPFAVWRLWLDRPVHADRGSFVGTSGYGPLDNVSVLERFEAGAAEWAQQHAGSVVEVHAYALDRADAAEPGRLQSRLRTELARVYPETAAAQVVGQEWLLLDDCPLAGTSPWRERPEVQTPEERLVLAGDLVRCDYPVALMERAATTGFLAANALLQRWGLAGHDLWSVPLRGRHRGTHALRRAVACPAVRD